VTGPRGRAPGLAPRWRGLCALCAVLPVSSLGRWAHAADEAAEAPSRVERRVPAVVVEGVRPAELPEDPTSFTTVIETERFEGERNEVEELLDRTPGVQVRRFGGPGQLSEISIRGSTGSQVVVLLDGVRLNTAQSGTVDLSTIPAELIERIEISRGGGSVRTGSDAIGGVVNIVTRRPSAKPETRVRLAGGSFGTWEGSVSQTGRVGGSELALGYDFLRTEGDWEFQTPLVELDGRPIVADTRTVERVNNETENHALLARVGRDLGEHWRLSVGDQLFYGSSGRPGTAAGQGASAGQAFEAHERRTRNLADVRLEAAALGAWELDAEARVFHRFDRSRFRDPDPPTQTGAVPIDSDDRNQALGARGELGNAFRTGPFEHDASLGLELRRDWLDAKGSVDRDRNTLGVFVQDEVAIWDERVRLIPALRLDRTEGFDEEWIPRLGLVVEPFSWLRLKGNVERSYRVPNFDELFFQQTFLRGNPGLEPEDALNADVGLEVGFERVGPVRDLSAELAFFRNDIDESIVFQLVSANVVAATNTGPARAEGIEFAGGFSLLDWIAFSASYTLIDSEVERNGGPIPGRARVEDSQRLEISPPSELFKLVGERHFTDDIPVSPGGGTRVLARTTYDLALVLDLSQMPHLGTRLPAERVLFSVNATNVTDRSVRDARFTPQPGRTLLFGVEAAW
jgi:vitamin B12 transporter